LRLKPGDTLLLCSDGLSDMIDDHAIWTTLHEHFYNLPAAVAELIDKANAAGGRDNITVVLLQVPGGRPVAAAAPVAAVPATAGATVPVREPAQNVMGRWGVPLLLAGGALLGLLAVGSLVGLFLVGRVNGRAVATPALTNGTPLLEVENTPLPLIGETPEGPPATAAIIVPVVTRVTDTPEPEASPVDTPALIPTLQATLTPTPTRRPPTTTPIATPTIAATATPVPLPGGGSAPPDAPPPPPPAATEAPVPTATPDPFKP
jgi:hypothetical protein